MAKWHFEKPRIPASGAALSLLALMVPVLSSTTLVDGALQFEALIWLSALIPAFLLAYYRSWRGVAVGFALAMVALVAAQILMLTWGVRLPNWPLMLALTGVFIGISLLLGVVVERLHKARAQAEALALLDPLTGLANRRYLDLLLGKSFAAGRRGIPLVVALFDIDRFKQYNDAWGHAAGDDVLCRFAGVLEHHTREMNLSARVGGEEFVSLLGASSVSGALVFVDRVREGLRQVQGLREPVTVSVGVAAYTPTMASPADLLAAADRALYRAKASGRDQVLVAGPVGAQSAFAAAHGAVAGAQGAVADEPEHGAAWAG
jgi:diguanylate cyclase (GGDEF)-like protein